MLTIKNFDDTLDPGILDEGLKLFQKNAVVQLQESDKNEWVASVKKGKTQKETYIQLGAKYRIEVLHCDCLSDDDMESLQACVHSAAMLFALREKKGISSKKVSKKGKKKAKDVSLELLDSLEPAQIYDFVKAQLTKDKGFKSQFMLHFSEREEVDEAAYKAIMLGAIKSIKGRKKYITAGDASKIAKALTPLLDQATAAEAKGHFNEAYVINKLFIAEVLPLADSIKTNSVFFNRMVDRVQAFHQQIASNKKAPLEFRKAFFKEIKEKTTEYWERHSLNRQLYFNTLVEAAKAQDKLDVVEQMLLDDLKKEQEREKVYEERSYYFSFSNQPRKILFLADFIKNDRGDAERAFAFLEENIQFDAIAFQVLPIYLEQGQAEKAFTFLKNNTEFGRSWNLKKRIKLAQIQYDILMAVGKSQEAAELAHYYLLETNFEALHFVDLVKNACSPAEWAVYRDNYLQITKRGQSYAKQTLFFQFLAENDDWDTIVAKLYRKRQLMSLFDVGKILVEQKPERFVQLFERMAAEGVQGNSRLVGYMDSYETLKYLHRILDMPEGKKAAKRLLDLIEAKSPYHATQAASFRQKHDLN